MTGDRHDDIRSDTVMIDPLRIFFDNVNHGAWYVYKRLFGSSVATCRLACSEISLSINEKKPERSPGKGQT